LNENPSVDSAAQQEKNPVVIGYSSQTVISSKQKLAGGHGLYE
jgi:hypothetical protein